jgi:predicted porin
MQKKIIALAIASALTVPAMAFAAESTLTGQVNMSYDMYKDGAASETTTNRLNSNNTRLIWKGAEDLGTGMSAIWQLDARLQADTGVQTASATTSPNTLFSGNNYLGLKSDSMGALMAGRMDAPYKVARRGLDVFFDTAGDNRSGNGAGIAGLLTSDLRLNNALAYMSPDMGGFTVALATVFGAEAANSTNNTKGSAYSLAGMYTAGPIYAELGYQETKAGSPGSGDMAGAATVNVDDKNTAMNLGGGYKTDAFVINALFEQTKYSPTTVTLANPEVKRTNYYLGGRFNISATDGIRLAYTKRGSNSGVTDDASQYALGYDHSMSKTTSVYATYVKTTDNATNAADPSAFSLGMKHSF